MSKALKILLSIALGLFIMELALQIWSLVVLFTFTQKTPELAPGSAPRVLCIGDSYTYGLGAPSRETSYPGALAELLRQRMGDGAPQVVNAGWPGQNSNDALRKLDAQLRDNRPVLVCVLLGMNDTWTRPARLESSDLGGDGSRWQLRFRLWRLARGMLGEYGGGALPTAEGERVAIEASVPSAAGNGWIGTDPPAVVRSTALALAGNLEQAIAELEAGLAADPAHAATYHQGLVQQRTALGRRDQAATSVAWLAAEYRDRPTSKVAESYAVALAAIGDRKQSLDVAREASARFPSNSALWWLVGQGLYDTGDLAAAERAHDRAIATGEAPEYDSMWRAAVRRDCARAACARDICKALGLLIAAMELDGDVDRCRIVLSGASKDLTADAVRNCLVGLQLNKDQLVLAQRLFSRDSSVANGALPVLSDERRRICEVLEHHLQLVVDRCRAQGADVILLSYPMPLPDLEAVQVKVARVNGLRRVDMLSRFAAEQQHRAREELFVHDGHCTAGGYRLMAEEVIGPVIEALEH